MNRTNKKTIINQKLDLIAECVFLDIQKRKRNALGLYMGEYGVLLFMLYYLKFCKNPTYASLMNRHIEELTNRFSSEMQLYTFCDGLTGILYLFDFLYDNNFIEIDINRIRPILDKYITTLMKRDIQQKYYDFMHGALGAGFYFLKKNGSIEYIYELIDFLHNTAIKDEKHNFFKWESRLVNEKTPVYNLALSHGIPSIIIFLSRVLEIGITNKKVIDMLIGSVNYILSQQLDFSQYGCFFPSFIHRNRLKSYQRSRLAWCYGDLGIGMAIWQAGKALRNEQYRTIGLNILTESTTRRNLKENLVLDAGLCHGSSGIAMIFHRMFIETQEKEFANAVEYWIEKTLSLSIFNDGLAGYKTYNVPNNWKCDYSFLTGISGIGLLFTSYLFEDEQNWDEILLLS